MSDSEQNHKDESDVITASDARNQLSDLLDRAMLGERITISRNGKKIAVLLGARDPQLTKVAEFRDPERRRSA
jgi:prevent-host-death family protein